MTDPARRPRRTLGRFTFCGAALAASFALAGCGGVLAPKGPVGLAERSILFDAAIIMLAIVVPTILATLAFAWWFRASNTKAPTCRTGPIPAGSRWSSGRFRCSPSSLLGGIAWIGSHELDPAKPLASDSKPLEVQVVSLDWKWLFIYPDQHVASVNQLVVPAGTPVHFTLTSASVWNSVLRAAARQPDLHDGGMTTQLNLQADQPGIFTACPPISAATASPTCISTSMRVPPERSTRGSRDAGAGPDARRRELRRSSPSRAATCRPHLPRRRPGLFDTIVAQKCAGPGPRAG